MTQLLDVPPDAVVATREYLLGVDEVVDLLDDRLTTKSPSGEPVYPYATLQQFGDVFTARRLYTVSLQFSVWGATRGEASLVGRTLLAALLAIRNHVTDEAVITGADEELGLGWEPDTKRNPPTPRFVFGVAVTVHSNPALVS